MVLYGVLRDVKLFGNVTVVVTLSDELEDLHLPVGQPGSWKLLLLVGALDHTGEFVQQLGGHRRGDERLTLGDGANRIGDLVNGDLLEQVAVGARLDRVVKVS